MEIDRHRSFEFLYRRRSNRPRPSHAHYGRVFARGLGFVLVADVIAIFCDRIAIANSDYQRKSAIKTPFSSSGSTGLGAILFGPGVMTVLGSLVLLFQAILLGHGGLTTLGANVFSMAIVGPWVAHIIYCFFCQQQKQKLGIFLAATLGDLITYLVTSLQLALAFPAASGGIMASFLKFAGIFALTQIPLAISEGLLTLLVWDWLQSYAIAELQILKKLKG